MKIYTKGGDSGETGLFGGQRVPKDHLRIRSYGTLDELNAALGCAALYILPQSELKTPLFRIQNELFQAGAELATPRGKDPGIALIQEADIDRLESEIDLFESRLQPLRSFILPGGSPAAAHLHLARTISRRAERETVILHRAEPLRTEILRYLNRLSDYLFVAARLANHEASIGDVPWAAPKKGS